VAPANVPEMAVVDELVPELREQDAEVTVVGDAAYGSGPARQAFSQAEVRVTLLSKAPPERNSTGGFPKSRLHIDLERGTVTCPAGNLGRLVGQLARAMPLDMPRSLDAPAAHNSRD
jgi:hypothetical protein